MPSTPAASASAAAPSVLLRAGRTICQRENTDPPILSWYCISNVSFPVSSRNPVRFSLLTAKPEMSR